MENETNWRNLLYDFALCALFGAGYALGVGAVYSFYQILWSI